MSDPNAATPTPTPVALVTGASRGIGAAIALELARQGMRVTGTATSEAGAAQISAALAAFPDCQRQLIITNKHNHATEHRTKDHVLNFSRLQCIWNKHLQRVIPANNIDLFVAEFASNVLDSSTTNTNTRTNSVNVIIDTADRDFGPVSRFTRQRPNFDDSFRNFGNLKFKQPANELDVGSRKDNLDPATGFSNLKNDRTNSVANTKALTRNLLAPWQQTLNFS